MSKKTKTRDVDSIALDDTALTRFPEGKQRAIRRCTQRLNEQRMTFATVDREMVDYIVKNAGIDGAAFIFSASLDAMREKVAALRGVDAPKVRTKLVADSYRPVGNVIDLMDKLQQSLQRTRPVSTNVVPPAPLQQPRHVLVDDARDAVELLTLPAGSRFKTPDSPEDGLRGRTGVLLYANDSRARVRYETTARTFSAKRVDKTTGEEHDVELTFDRSGETDIAARTMVVALPTLS